jgi:diguanylate cyclase (GGDEF)-like protein/PAS domain S-box-containing protein
MGRIWAWYLAAAVAVAVGGRVVPGVPYIITDAVVVVSAFVAVVVGVRRHDPDMRRMWRVILAAFALYVVSSVGYAIADPGSALQVVAVAIHVAGWALFITALVMVLRERSPRGDRDLAIDSLLLTVSAAVTAWVLVFEPILRDAATPLLERVLVLSYPVLDVLSLPLVARLLVGGGRKSPALRLLLLSILSAAAADTVFAWLVWRGVDVAGPGVVYPINFALIGAAGLHESMRDLSRPGRAHVRPVTRLRFALFGLVVLLPPSLLFLPRVRTDPAAVSTVSVGTIVLFALVAARMWRLLDHVEALTVRRGEQRFQTLIHHAGDVIIVVDRHRSIVFVTPTVHRWGHQVDDLVGRPIDQLVHRDDLTAWRTHAAASDAAQLPFQGRIRQGTGGWREVEGTVADRTGDADVGGFVVTLQDVTDQNVLRRKLAHRSHHDALTGLPNRELFHTRIEEAAAEAGTEGLAVILIDLEKFKSFNDSLGRIASDRLLTTIAQRLLAVAGTNDVPARLGSDDFAMLVTDADPSRVQDLAEWISRGIENPIVVGDRQVVVHASVGAAIGSPDVSPALLLRNADVALHTAKVRRTGRVEHFDPELLRAQLWRQRVKAALPLARYAGQLELVYQPIVRLGDGFAVAAEALLRWEHPELGRVSPLDFIALAEDSGDILDIGRWVLEEACRTAADWQRRAAGRDGPVAVTVNISVRQLADDGFVGDVDRVLRDTNLPPDGLVLELTESVLADEHTRHALHGLKELGVRIAIDDFGTGYSSLRYLQRFPLDVLKMDRSFVAQVATDATLARAILGLAASLDLEALAEGIEEAEQVEVLRGLGCMLGQGYHFARPGPADAVVNLLDAVGAENH